MEVICDVLSIYISLYSVELCLVNKDTAVVIFTLPCSKTGVSCAKGHSQSINNKIILLAKMFIFNLQYVESEKRKVQNFCET